MCSQKNIKKPKSVSHITHKIVTTENRPIFRKPYQIPYAYTDAVHTQVGEMLENGIISPSKSPWNAPVILVKKKDNTLRFVCDFRSLNDVTVKDTYPLPRISEVIDRMDGTVLWTTLDAASAYWSIPLEDADKEKTSFSTPRGKYEFNVTPYGLCNAGATYQRMIDLSLSGLSTTRVLAYLDDIVIFSRTIDSHYHQLHEVLECLRKHNITLNLSKCSFAMNRVDFLGYTLSAAGVQPQERLTEAIRNFTRPSTKKALKRFLGLSSYYRDFIPMFAEISSPLNALTSDKSVYAWNEECEFAFERLKYLLCSYPLLAFPRISEPFIVEVDASDLAVGGVLLQDDCNGKSHPVAYFSNTLQTSQRKWSAYSKEAYALVLALRHWKVYLTGTHFIIRSDHNPLVTLRKTKDPRGKFGRWLTELEELSFEIHYKPGKINTVPDALSRNACGTLKLPTDDLDEKIYAQFTDDENFAHQLQCEQNKDVVISDAKQKILNGVKIAKGRLRHVQKQLRVESDILTKNGRPVVPGSLRKFVMQEMHRTGHLGTEKLYSKMQNKFYWPNMYRYIQNHVTQCDICQRCKQNPHPPKAPLLPIQDPEYPMQFISIDIAYMVKDDDGYNYFLMVGDLFSKYINAIPLRNQSAESISQALYKNWILIHGLPNFLLSDQGSNVDGNVMHGICEKFGIEKRRSSAYHSQGNGFAERSIRNVKEILRTHLCANKLPQITWRTVLKELIFVLNTSISCSTKCVPYHVVYGREAILPEDVKLGTSKQQSGHDIVSPSDFAEEMKIKLAKVYETVNENLKTSRDRMKRSYDKSIRLNSYTVGDKVW